MPSFIPQQKRSEQEVYRLPNLQVQDRKKLTIAHLLKPGAGHLTPKFSLQDGLSNGGLRETPEGARRLLYNLAEPILTGGTGMHAATFGAPATVSIGGNIAARALNSEFYFENSWTNQNVMAIRNTVPGYGSFSTLRLLERDGWEMGSFGYGNTSITEQDTRSYPWYEGVYIETGNPNPDFIMRGVDGAPFAPTAPSPLRFIQSGVIPDGFMRDVGYFYVRQEFIPNGDINFYDVSAPFEQRQPALQINRHGPLIVTPEIEGAAMYVRNRLAKGSSSVKFVSDTGQTIGSIGYDNPEAIPDLAKSLSIVAGNGGSAVQPPEFKIVQARHTPDGDQYEARLVITSAGRIVQAVPPQAPNDTDLTQNSHMSFYVDEQTRCLMVKVRLSDGAYCSGEIVCLGDYSL